MHKKYIIIIVIAVICMGIASLSVYLLSDNEELPESPRSIIENVCSEYGYDIDKTFNWDDKEEQYESNIYDITLGTSGYTMQIIINEPKNFNSIVHMSIIGEIKDVSSKYKNIEEHSEFIIGLINAFREEQLEENAIKKFFVNDENMTLAEYSDREEYFYYFLKKKEELSDGCSMHYELYSYIDEVDFEGPDVEDSVSEDLYIYFTYNKRNDN